MIKVLFVCMGNICRSPTAEGVFRRVLQLRKLEDKVEVSSAGTHGFHNGESPDRRAQEAAARRGYDLSRIRARKVSPQDLEYFDLILAMDHRTLVSLREICPLEHVERLGLFMDYARNFHVAEVPDPYYGRGEGFDLV
ncbi:MAG: low molecular weight phosphotyrosine protein phosphatase, partial [Deltaproteobacteria bacterium]|nr:low molecular weight phosphotyrosine protein phosphatase [Deltaproteobacteria bacterium]